MVYRCHHERAILSVSREAPAAPQGREEINRLYQDRPLAAGFPGLEQQGVAHFSSRTGQREAAERYYLDNNLRRIRRLIALAEGAPIAIVGCGPTPWSLQMLLEQGFDAVGVEPVAGSCEQAAAFIGTEPRILQGCAEELPLADNSQQVVLLEAVLEHVDSPLQSLQEAYRVLKPGGVCCVSTTNRYYFSPTGRNGEYRLAFFNWLPRTLRECYVFHHLHYDPRLANYSPRPAVHWFSYADLCELGRQARFAQFYSIFDLSDPQAPSVQASAAKRLLLRMASASRWLKALLLLQFGHLVYMYKRDQGAVWPTVVP